MAVVDSPWTSYSDTVPQKRVITDVISLIDPSDAPLIEKMGGLDGAASKFRFSAWPSTKCEWLEDTLAPLTDTLNTATIASDATSATVADASKFQAGHIILVNSQTFTVSAVNTSTNVLTVASLGGTTASHATGTTISIVGMARVEGSTSSASPYTSRTTGTNYTQIFHKEIKVTRTQKQLAQWGISNEFDYQASKAVPELMRLIERHLFVSDATSAGSATTPRIMGGLPYFAGLTGANASSGASLTKAKIDTVAQMAYEDGGSGKWVMPCSPTNFAKIRAFYDSSNYLRIERGDAVVGMPAPTVVLTPFGEIELLLDRWATNGNLFMLDLEHIGMKTYAPFTQEPLAKTGDSDVGQVIGEFTFCLRQLPAHGALTSVT